MAKRGDSLYDPGRRSGAWQKMRVNRGQEFVIGGYTMGGSTFDALVFGYYEGGELIYAARTRNGFTPKLRAELLRKFKPLETSECPSRTCPRRRQAAGECGSPRRKWKSVAGSGLSLLRSLSSWSGPRTRTCGTAVSWGCGWNKMPRDVRRE